MGSSRNAEGYAPWVTPVPDGSSVVKVSDHTLLPLAPLAWRFSGGADTPGCPPHLLGCASRDSAIPGMYSPKTGWRWQRGVLVGPNDELREWIILLSGFY